MRVAALAIIVPVHWYERIATGVKLWRQGALTDIHLALQDVRLGQERLVADLVGDDDVVFGHARGALAHHVIARGHILQLLNRCANDV